jgi:hypothetical protein
MKNFKGLLLLLFVLPTVGAAAEEIKSGNANWGCVQITLRDASSQAATTAQLYIKREGEPDSEGMVEMHGSTSLRLPIGSYKIYAARVEHQGSYIDHYSTPQASVQISPDQEASILLTLRRMENGTVEISEGVAKDMGLQSNVIKALN